MLSDGERLYLIAQETLGWADGAEWSYPLGDALGSVRQVVDGAGEVLDDRSWTPFGVEEGTAQGGLGYTGEWWDVEVSLLYLRARWYDPAAGRFISLDPIISDLNDPQSIHEYNYAFANPVRFIDPSGLRGILPWDQYNSTWGKSLGVGDPDIIADLGNTDDTLARGAIAKIELNFQGNPAYQGVPPEILLAAYFGFFCGPLYNLDYPDDMIAYDTQSIYERSRDYNRYDWLISGWVDYWNWRARLEGKLYQLDPNFIKAVAYIETTLGYETGNNENAYEGIMQLGGQAVDDLTGNGPGSVQWGPINVVDVEVPSHNIGGGVRWLMHKYEEDAGQKSWLRAYAYYAGFAGNTEEDVVKNVSTVYNTGLDVKWLEVKHYLFTRSVLFPSPR